MSDMQSIKLQLFIQKNLVLTKYIHFDIILKYYISEYYDFGFKLF